MILEIRGITLFATFQYPTRKNAPFTCNLICNTTLKSTHQIYGNTLISTNSANAGIKVCRKYDVLQYTGVTLTGNIDHEKSYCSLKPQSPKHAFVCSVELLYLNPRNTFKDHKTALKRLKSKYKWVRKNVLGEIAVLKNRETGGIAKQGARNRGVRL